MAKIAIIGGSGLTNMPGLTVSHREMVKTEYGAPSSPLIHGELSGSEVIFLARHGRRHTIFYGAKNDTFRHIDFTEPYSPLIRERLITACNNAKVNFIGNGVYGATQGPRLETAAEIRRMENDGCTIVGMTGMPEAALARELDIQYACCAMVVNRAAGKAVNGIDFSQTESNLKESVELIRGVLEEVVKIEMV